MKSLPSSVALRFGLVLACLGICATAHAGNPTPYLAPTPLIFPDTLVGEQSAPLVLQLVSPPNAAANYTFLDAQIGGPNATQFAIVDNQCAGEVLTPGESCQMLITMAPSSVGLKEAVITVSYTVPLAGVPPIRDQAALRGNGVGPAVAASLPATGSFALTLAALGLLAIAWFGGRRLLH